MARAKKAKVRKAAKADATKAGATIADKVGASKKSTKAPKVEKKKILKKKAAKRKPKRIASEQPPIESVASVPVDLPAIETQTGKETAVKIAPAASGVAAEASGELNKSEWTRVYLETHPRAKAKDIVAALAEQGVTVTQGYAAGLRFKARMAKKKARRVAKKAAVEAGVELRTSGSVGKTNADRFSLDSLLAAKKLAESLGGVEAARAAVDALIKLTT